MSRRLVIDASVAGSAGSSENLTSRRCREFLQEVLARSHRLVSTEAIDHEWSAHQSRFALTWRASMEAKGRVARLGDPHDESLIERISTHAASEPTRTAMLKDAHLVVAATMSDNAIASRDERARKLYDLIAADVKGLTKVAWVSISETDDRAINWLKGGARSEPEYRLGGQPLGSSRVPEVT